MTAAPECVIVMPAYNEEACLAPVILEWLALAAPRGFALLVIDDGSRDRTPRLLDELALAHPALRVLHQANQGHGPAILRGYREAIGSGAAWIFQTDSDGQFSPADFDLLWRERRRGPFLLGYRRHRSDGWLRAAMSAVNRFLARLLFGVPLRDPNSPFRLMRADYLDSLLAALPPGLFAPNVFLSLLAAPLVEIPVAHRPRLAGQASITPRRALTLGLRCLREMLAFRRSMGSSRS